MWKIKIKAIPVVVGALGMIKKEMQKYVNKIPGNLPPTEIQKIVLNILHLNYIFIEILYEYFYTALYKTFYMQYLHNPNSPH